MEAHKPVLLKEVMQTFNPQSGETYIDATVNGGGHAIEILKMVGQDGLVLGIDWDCGLIENLKDESKKLKTGNLKLFCDNYINLGKIAEQEKTGEVSGIIFDLGFSSHHLEKSGRGFSFQKDEPLDMRYNTISNELTAEKIVNNWSGEAIETLLREYGEERFSRSIVRGILRARKQKKITRAAELVAVIQKSVPYYYLKSRLNPATRTFQALRIAVNGELVNLEKTLPQVLDLLKPAGKLVIISFHSLEDRIVKNFFRQKGKEGIIKVLTKKPLVSSEEELRTNPRARSAKLRAAEKL